MRIAFLGVCLDIRFLVACTWVLSWVSFLSLLAVELLSIIHKILHSFYIKFKLSHGIFVCTSTVTTERHDHAGLQGRWKFRIIYHY